MGVSYLPLAFAQRTRDAQEDNKDSKDNKDGLVILLDTITQFPLPDPVSYKYGQALAI